MKFLKVLMTRDGKPIDFEKISSDIEKICKKFQIELLYIFGSYASNIADRLSDLDLAYLSKGEFDLGNIKTYLSIPKRCLEKKQSIL